MKANHQGSGVGDESSRCRAEAGVRGAQVRAGTRTRRYAAIRLGLVEVLFLRLGRIRVPESSAGTLRRRASYASSFRGGK